MVIASVSASRGAKIKLVSILLNALSVNTFFFMHLFFTDTGVNLSVIVKGSIALLCHLMSMLPEFAMQR